MNHLIKQESKETLNEVKLPESKQLKPYKENSLNKCFRFAMDSLVHKLQGVLKYLENASLTSDQFMSEVNNGNFVVVDEGDKQLAINPKFSELISEMDIVNTSLSKNTLKTIKEYMVDYLLSYNSYLHKISDDYIDCPKPVSSPVFAYGSLLKPIDTLNEWCLCDNFDSLSYSIFENSSSKVFIDSYNDLVLNGLPMTIYISHYAQLISDSNGNAFQQVNYIDYKDNMVKTGIRFSVNTGNGQIKEVLVAVHLNLAIVKVAYIKENWVPLQCSLVSR